MTDLPWWLKDAIIPIIVALASSALWEGWWTARRLRKSVRLALAAEVENNVRQATLQLSLRPSLGRDLAAEFRLSTTIFDALASQLGELPYDAIVGVAGFYRHCSENNRVAEQYADLVTERDTTPLPRHAGLAQEALERAAAYYRQLEYIRDRGAGLATLLRSGRGNIDATEWRSGIARDESRILPQRDRP